MDSFYFVLLAIGFVLAANVAIMYVSATRPRGKANQPALIRSAAILYGIISLMIVDYFLEISGVGPTCGTGFNEGNCFLFDGLGIVFYYFLIPSLGLIAFVLLLINYFKKTSSKKSKR